MPRKSFPDFGFGYQRLFFHVWHDMNPVPQFIWGRPISRAILHLYFSNFWHENENRAHHTA